MPRHEPNRPWRHLYNTARWRNLRKAQLTAEPLCRMCARLGRVTAATVADHVTPHKGDEALFFDRTNLQSLCKPCHDGAKQREERGRPLVAVGADGWPVG